MQALLCEGQELTERVPLGTDSMWTGLALLHQAVGKDMLQQGSQVGGRGHDRPSQYRSSRRMASRISSGEPSKYHCVSARCTCPR